MDIILYAVIAAVLLVRLWSVLGRSNDEEPKRFNPFAVSDEPEAAVVAPVPASPLVLGALHAAPASLAGGIEQVTILDPSFDEKKFLLGARSAFVLIVESFAAGDLARIEPFLGSLVLPRFREAVEQRLKAGQKMESKVLRVIDAEITTARVEESHAFLTLRFVSEQKNILRDQQGQVLGGGADKKPEIVTDIWIFERDVTSTDPNWILVETRV